jgi:hypothetical protein
MGLGVPELIIILALVGLPVGGFLLFWIVADRRARRFGYASAGEYLRAAPRSDAEKRDAADLALKGLIWCVLGAIFAPLILIGLLPLFYGGRKMIYASMGLGLVDDPDSPEA